MAGLLATPRGVRRGASSIGRSFLRTVKYNIEARLAHNSYMSTSPQGTSDGARPTTSTTTAPIAIPTAAANKQRYGQHQSTSLRAAEQQSQEARVSVSLSVSAPMGDARAFSTAATALPRLFLGARRALPSRTHVVPSEVGHAICKLLQ